MKTGMAAALSAALALSALLSGCVEEAKTGPAAKGPLTADTNLIKEGRDLRFELKETDELVSPSWQVGEWFGHHVFFEGGPAAGLHINTIVTEERSDGWFLAADDKQIAKIEAAFDIPILGPIKKDLSTTAFGGDWNLYDFPLKVGKTWKRTLVTDFEDPANSKVEVSFTASFNPKITTPDGDRPGFDITGTLKDDKEILKFDFVPAIGWYAHFYYFELGTANPDDWIFHVMSMGHGTGWTGTYYVSTGKLVLQGFHGVGVDPDDPTHPFVDPKPYETFTVPNGATYLYGFVGAFAFAGAYQLEIIDPQNNRHSFQALGTPEGGQEAEVDIPAVPGEWRVVAVGAGAFAAHFAFLFAITERSGTL